MANGEWRMQKRRRRWKFAIRHSPFNILHSGFIGPMSSTHASSLRTGAPAAEMGAFAWRFILMLTFPWRDLPSRETFKAARANFAPRPVPERFTAEFPLDLCLRPRSLRAAAEESALLVPAARRLARRYRELRCPVAILAGSGDAIVEPEHAPRLHEVLASASLTIVPGVGHMLHHAAPERVAAAVALLAAQLR